MRVFEASSFGKEGLYSKQMEQAGDFQGKVSISDDYILTKENRVHDLAKVIIIDLTPKA